MDIKILFYVCNGNGEFDLFEAGRPLEKVKHPPIQKNRTFLHGSSQDAYKVKINIQDGYCFFVFNDEKCIGEKDAVKNCVNIETRLDVALFGYFQMIENWIRDYFDGEERIVYPSVFVITHWGGGSPAEIDQNEKKIAAAASRIATKGNRFSGWRAFSASETMRPGLFSDRFSTVVARKNGSKAELPDAEECERILERHLRNEYGRGDTARSEHDPKKLVDWSEQDPKKLYKDIMQHLNH